MDCKSIYNYTIGEPTIATLGAVSSMIHFKLNQHIDEEVMTTKKVDLEACRYYFLVSMTIHQGTNIK